MWGQGSSLEKGVGKKWWGRGVAAPRRMAHLEGRVKSGGAVQGWGSADLSWVCMHLLSCLNRLVGRPDAKKGVQNSLE